MITAAMAFALLGLATTSPPPPPVALADKTAPTQAPAKLLIDGVQVTAQPLVTAVGRTVSVPVELQATWVRGEGAPPKRIAVKLCSDWQCGVWQRIELAVGTLASPAPAVVRRVGIEHSGVVIGSFTGGQTANTGVNNGGPQGLVGVIGELPSRLPQAGWQFHAQFGRDHVQGGVSPADITATARRFPELIHGFSAIVLGPGVELGPLLRTEVLRYLRGGGRLVVPDAVGETLRPKVDPGADARAVLDGKAPLRHAARTIVIDRAPALVETGNTVLREEARGLSLPVRVTPVHSGLLYQYAKGATGEQLVDALLFTNPRLSTDAYNYGAPANVESHVRDVASVWLAKLAPKGSMALLLLVWGVLVFVVLRRGGGRFSWAKLGGLAAVSGGLVAGVLAVGHVMRGDGEEAVVRVVTAREGADFGIERGARLRWAAGAEDTELRAPAGTFARPVAAGRATRHSLTYRPLSNNAIALGLNSDRPAGVAWSRSIPTKAGLELVWPADTNQPQWQVAPGVKNTGEVTFDRVLVSTGSAQSWALQPLAPGEGRTPSDLLANWDALDEPPADRREAAVRRFAAQAGQLCPVVENESHRPCAIGFTFTDEGLDILVSIPRLGYAWEPGPVEAPTPTQAEVSPPAEGAGAADEGGHRHESDHAGAAP